MLSVTTGENHFTRLIKSTQVPTVSLHANPAKRVRFPAPRLLSPQPRAWISNFQLLPPIQFHANKSPLPLFSCKCLYIGRDKCNQSFPWQGRRPGLLVLSSGGIIKQGNWKWYLIDTAISSVQGRTARCLPRGERERDARRREESKQISSQTALAAKV